MNRLRSTEIAELLTSAMAERKLVRLTTRFDDFDVRGYVLSVGPGFVLLAVVSDRIWFDGFECFRRPDIIEVEDEQFAAFTERALALRDEKLPDLPSVSLVSIEELLVSAGAAFPLLTIHTEEVDPDVCWIGKLSKVEDGEISLLGITPGAEWDDEPTLYRTADITRVSFGADYENALWLVAQDRAGATTRAKPRGT